MDQTVKSVSILLISALCFQCATPQDVVLLSTLPKVQASCRYSAKGRRIDETEVECLLENNGATPARISLRHASLEDPSADIKTVDVGTIKHGDELETIVVVLGVIVIVGVIIALVSKSKVSSVHIPMIHVRSYSSVSPSSNEAKTLDQSDSKSPIPEEFEISGYRSARLVFVAKHGTQRPKYFVINLGANERDFVKVPIKLPVGWSQKRADF